MKTISIKRVSIEDREILANLCEKYTYEFSQYTELDVNHLGLYGYKFLDYYWCEDKRWAYFIMVDDQLAGFVMVNDFPEASDRELDYSIAEFFVLYKYRNKGIGYTAFNYVCDKHKGKWQLKAHPKNTGSIQFWHKAIHTYTQGHYECIESYPNSAYEDGSLGSIFFFES